MFTAHYIPRNPSYHAFQPTKPLSTPVLQIPTTPRHMGFFRLLLPGSGDGNLVLREGKPGDPIRMDPVWESGKPFEKKVKSFLFLPCCLCLGSSVEFFFTIYP